MTNADKIRAMTDDELSKFLVQIELYSPPYCIGFLMCAKELPCAECCEVWLKQEVQE